jgi:hypothetical protein
MNEQNSEKGIRFNPKLLSFSWGLAESQENRNSRPTPDQILAPFITEDVVRKSIDELLKQN